MGFRDNGKQNGNYYRGLGFKGFGLRDLGFRVWGLGFRVHGILKRGGVHVGRV